MKKFNLLVSVLILVSVTAFGQTQSNSQKSNEEVAFKKHSIGASLFMLTAFLPDPADYVLLTYGYQINKKSRVFAEYNTWKYPEPMGTYGNSEEMYPGIVRTHGIGVGYQHFIWKGLFATGQATPFHKTYLDEQNKKIGTGFQLYLQLAAGYRLEFFKKRWYVEPSYAMKYWPIDTKVPESFAKVEKGTPKYNFEPGLNFGFKF